MGLEKVSISCWLLVRAIDRVALVDRPHRYPIVVFGRDVSWRRGGIGQRKLERFHRLIIPGPGDHRCRRLLTLRHWSSNSCDDGGQRNCDHNELRYPPAM